MEQMTLSNRQLFWMIGSMQIVMLVLLTSSATVQVAKQSAWISSILVMGIGISMAYFCAKVSTYYPGQTMIKYTRSLFGKWVGSAVSLLYLLYWISVYSAILRQFTAFIIGTILPETPITSILIIMSLAVLYPALQGITVIGRLSEVLGPIILAGILIPIMLAANRLHFYRLEPVFGDISWLDISMGTLPSAPFLGDCIVLMMTIAFVKEQAIVRHAVFGVMMAGLGYVVSILAVIMMFGYLVTESSPYPLLVLVRSISLGGIVENLDAIITAIWMMSIYIKLSLYLFAASYGAAEWFGVKNWRPFVWGISILCILLSMIPRNYIEVSVIFTSKVAVPYIFPILMLGIPLLMLIMTWIKNKRTKPLPTA
ncbi:GerAB/ArcD/ProY family transporter [Paenibacillus luteus]|uniref:GerAB/ArcD/ProY family transporter n=1 Tax=Paenibacillus luteus TaxID=2545753 RepID=UPI00114455DA|nr:endospore germination permease [Paenibacillus luteus]